MCYSGKKERLKYGIRGRFGGYIVFIGLGGLRGVWLGGSGGRGVMSVLGRCFCVEFRWGWDGGEEDNRVIAGFRP